MPLYFDRSGSYLLVNILHLDIVNPVMFCLRVSLRTVLPNWIQSLFFSDNDDASFWGGDEEQSTYECSVEASPHKARTYMTTEAATYSNSTRDFKNSTQIETKPNTCRSAGECRPETGVGYCLLTHMVSANRSRAALFAHKGFKFGNTGAPNYPPTRSPPCQREDN